MSTMRLSDEVMFNSSSDFIGPPKPNLSKVDSDYSVEVDASLEVQGGSNRVMQLLKKFGSVSSIIRVSGVAAVVLSMCLFLFDGMTVVNDTQRFYTMLMLTGLLSAGGFALGFVLKEQRGARSFFGLALLSVPVNFTVLGALFYSVFQLDQVSTAYPTMAHWEIFDIASLGVAAMIALVSLVPVTVIGVSIMARESRVWLGTALLASSSMLLLPIRDTTWIAPVVALLVVALINLVRKHGENTVSLKTLSGRFVQVLLFLPPTIMLFRSFWLYSVSDLSVLMICLTVFAAVRYASARLQSTGTLANGLHILSALVALVSGLYGAAAFHPPLSAGFLGLVFVIIFGGLMFELESRVKSVPLARLVSIVNYTGLTSAVVVHQVLTGGMLALILGLFITLSLTMISVVKKRREELFIAGAAFAVLALLNTENIIAYFSHTGWLGFAVLGGVAILSASLIERFGPMMSLRVKNWHQPT